MPRTVGTASRKEPDLDGPIPITPPSGRVPARIIVEKMVEWSDTDASGHFHNSFAVRLLEAAEAELWRQLDLVELMPSLPRVRIAFDFHHRLWFGELVTVHLQVRRIGRSSLTWAFTALAPSGSPAITGETVVVHAPDTGAVPWPEPVRERLETAGCVGSRRQVWSTG
jgi:acyl-CoA thioesterase FadM